MIEFIIGMIVGSIIASIEWLVLIRYVGDGKG